MTPPLPHLPAGLRYDVLDPHATDREHAELLRGFDEAVARGFHEGRLDDERHRHSIESWRADQVTLRGVWPEKTAVADASTPIATFASWNGRMNVGADTVLPLHMISEVTVAPSHRRRGLLRTLMTHDLADAAAHGMPLAALTISEGTIYGRFGFGPSLRLRHLEVDVTSRFALRGALDDGRIELVEPAAAWPAVQEVFASRLARTRGLVDRPHFHRAMLTGEYSVRAGGPDKRLRAALGVAPDGEVDGYVLYRVEESADPASSDTIKVEDLGARTDAAYLRLWRFLADVDLVGRVQWQRARLAEPLDWAVADPRGVRTTGFRDQLWVRVLDLPAALAARPWGADGQVVLDVDDALGHVAGRWQVEVVDGRAKVSATEEPGEVHLDAETLGALYLGDVDTPTLAAAGRLVGAPEALARWSAMADVGPAPYNTTGF